MSSGRSQPPPPTPPPSEAVLDRTIMDAPAPREPLDGRRPSAPAKVVAPAPLSAESLAGLRIRQYEIIRELGRGGMGQVLLARDTKLGRRVAIKFLAHPTEESIERSLAEARATASCVQENIVVVHEADVYEGRPYIVLEYLEGQTLRELMVGARIPPARAVELMVPVVRALQRAHEAGLVHRDLKPENILITGTGTIKVLDFGLAQSATDATTGLAGTLPYMAPEQFGQDTVDARTDLWAVGVILFEMLAGKHPLDPITPQKLIGSAAMLDKPMPALVADGADVPQKLEELIGHCLQKKKAQRFADARELLGELEPLLPRHAGRHLTEDECPYPGLSAFQESDGDRFFGRSQDIARLVSQLRGQPLVGVVGPSGVGKSSFVRAGLVPTLRASGESWEVLVLRPGRSPLTSLATLLDSLTQSGRGEFEQKVTDHSALVARLGREPGALGTLLRQRARQRGGQVLLFVDQFEELYTLVPTLEERAAFTACLSGAADDAAAPVRVLVSMRSDLLDRVTEDRRFLDDLMRGLLFLQPIGPDGLREAMSQPLAMLGYAFETPEMLTDMLGALAHSEGALPLLQFAALKLWEGRDTRRKILTRARYDAMGGVAGALATHADEVIAGLPPDRRKLVRALFLRLVTPDRTRAVIEVQELSGLAADPNAVRPIIDHLVSARLLVLQGRGDAGATVELVHESLISSWPTLGRWLEEGKEDAVYLAQLRTAAAQWENKRRAQGLLWRGEAETEARLWRSRYKGELSSLEQAYLDAVFSLAGRAARIRRIAVVSVIAVLLAIVAGGSVSLIKIRRAERVAVEEKDRAQRETDRAREAETKIKEQLDVIQQEQTQKLQARAEVARGKEDLAGANQRLQKALTVAESESQKAKDAARKSQDLAESVRKANTRLEGLLAQERARSEKLERERKKITSDLR